MAEAVDPSSGFCSETKTFHSLHPPIRLPPETQPLSVASHAFSLLPSPLPPNPAFVDAATGAAVSYPQFLSQVRTLASSLRSQLGLSNGHVAFLISPASLDVPVLYFALLSLGAVVSPANPTSTAAEISHLFQISNPSIAFATSSTASKLPGHVTTVLLDSPEFFSLLSPGRTTAVPAEIRQADPAAILYSSGTTGRVKGVVLTHRNLIAQLGSYAAAAAPGGRGAAPAAVQMVTVPLFHAIGFLFCVKGVAAGDTTVVQTERFDARRTMRSVARFRVTNLFMVPPALLVTVKALEDDHVVGGGPYDLSSLEAVSFGAAPVGVELIRRVAARLPNVRLTQGYGLTEVTSGVFRTTGLEGSRRLGSSGRLISGCEAKIVDPATGIALSPGIQGEIWLRGPTIMKGYIGDPEATSAVLNSEGWLKTGDLCYIDNDGFLFVVDRLKELIKYKGYQVPPAELEHLLQKHPEIIEAAVIPYPDEEAGEVPMAFVVRQPHSTLDADQVMDFVAKQVAPYKKIRRVSFVNSIPKNATGKILRKDLVKSATSEICSRL